MPIKYTIAGESFTRPVDLPEGFTIEEKWQPLKRTVTTTLDITLGIEESERAGAGYVLLTTQRGGGSKRTNALRLEELAQFRDAINEVLDVQEPTEVLWCNRAPAVHLFSEGATA